MYQPLSHRRPRTWACRTARPEALEGRASGAASHCGCCAARDGPEGSSLQSVRRMSWLKRFSGILSLSKDAALRPSIDDAILICRCEPSRQRGAAIWGGASPDHRENASSSNATSAKSRRCVLWRLSRHGEPVEPRNAPSFDKLRMLKKRLDQLGRRTKCRDEPSGPSVAC